MSFKTYLSIIRLVRSRFWLKQKINEDRNSNYLNWLVRIHNGNIFSCHFKHQSLFSFLFLFFYALFFRSLIYLILIMRIIYRILKNHSHKPYTHKCRSFSSILSVHCILNDELEVNY